MVHSDWITDHKAAIDPLARRLVAELHFDVEHPPRQSEYHTHQIVEPAEDAYMAAYTLAVLLVKEAERMSVDLPAPGRSVLDWMRGPFRVAFLLYVNAEE